MSEQLKPCPFCGNTEISEDDGYIMCQCCGAMIDQSDAENRDYVAAWNRRPEGTTSDKYRAELYDEVWQKARDLGYGNVTEALAAAPSVKSMVDRFLASRLPGDFSPDGGISFTPPSNPNWWPTGTNLFTADQAKELFKHVLGGKRENLPMLAAKDARIAELEKRMRPMPPRNFDLTEQEQFIRRRADEIFDENQADEQADDYMYMNEKMCREAAAIEWGAMQALASQQQAEPVASTPSEDGGEVRHEAVKAIHDVLAAVPCASLYSMAEAVQDRIVAAKDAKIFELRQHKNDYMEAAEETARALRNEINDHQEEIRRLDALVAELRAQPARQMGGDEPVAWHTDDHLDDKSATTYDKVVAERWVAKGWPVTPLYLASLAPAAVVVDSSAPLVNALEQVRTMVGNDEYADDVIGFINRSIYNHANLNRRAIPVELLKKQYDRIDYAAAMNDTHAVKALTNELRALLGNELERKP